MAFPTSVNSQITDSVSQNNVSVVGEAPAFALGSVYQLLAHATGLLFANAVNQQQQMAVTAQAVTTSCVMTLLGNRS